jgi:hypothetical protein
VGVSVRLMSGVNSDFAVINFFLAHYTVVNK